MHLGECLYGSVCIVGKGTAMNNSISINVYTDSASGHANISFHSDFRTSTYGANQKAGRGVYQTEDFMLGTRPAVSTTYQTTPEQYQRALDYVNSLLGSGYFYGLTEICTTFVSDIYNMTRMPGMPPEWGFLFTPAQIEEIRKATLVDLRRN